MNFIDYLKMMAGIYNAIVKEATPLMRSRLPYMNAEYSAGQVAYSVFSVHQRHGYSFAETPTFRFALNGDESEFSWVEEHFGQLLLDFHHIDQVLGKIEEQVGFAASFYKPEIKPKAVRKIKQCVRKTAAPFLGKVFSSLPV